MTKNAHGNTQQECIAPLHLENCGKEKRGYRPQAQARDLSHKLTRRASLVSTQECTHLAFRVTLGARPASKHEGNLVHKVRDVVDHIEEGLVHCSEQVAEQVAKGVDGPSNCDNHAHVVEG